MRRVAIVLLAGVAALVVVAVVAGRPVAWVQAWFIMWDLAAGGARTIWQEVVDAGWTVGEMVGWRRRSLSAGGADARRHGPGAGRSGARAR